MARKKKNTEVIADGVQNTEKKQEAKYPASSLQAQIPFERTFPNGIFQTGLNHFSKLYKFKDMNFLTLTEDEQIEMLERYLDFVNKFQDNISIQLLIVNKKRTMEEVQNDFYIKKRSDGKFDSLIDTYNSVIESKIQDGNNDIAKERYICISFSSDNERNAFDLFNNIDSELNEVISAINKTGVEPVSLYDRLKLIDYIYNGNDKYCSFDEQCAKYVDDQHCFDEKFLKSRIGDIKNLIMPQILDASSKTMLRLGEERYAKSFSLNDIPMSLDTKFLTQISNVPCEMVVSVFLNTLKHNTAVNKIKIQNNTIKGDIAKAQQTAAEKGYSAELISEDLQIANQEAMQLRHDVVVDGKKLFNTYITVSILGNSEDDIKNSQDLLKMKLGNFSVRPHDLYREQIQGLHQSMPFAKAFIDFSYMLSSDSVCALFPFNIREIVDKNGIFYGVNAVSKNMIMYNRKDSSNPNGLIFGRSGSGKSFITKGEIISNYLNSEDDDVIILDPEREYSPLAEALNGEVIYLQTKTDKYINPCDMSMEWDSKDADPLTEKCDFMVGLVESILGSGRECNSFEVNVIHRATNRMYQEYIETMEKRRQEGIMQDIDVTISPTLEDFYTELLQDNSPEGNKLAMAIEPYCIGNYNIFAHRTNIDSSNHLIIYDIHDLPQKMQDMAMKVCLSDIWIKICRNREAHKKTWVYLDEFHIFCQSRQTLSTIKAYYKRSRKYGGIMTGITQDISDVGATLEGMGIIENSNFILLMNQNANGRELTRQRYGCSEKMLSYITDKPVGMGLIYNGESIIPFDYHLPSDNEMYKIMTTKPTES